MKYINDFFNLCKIHWKQILGYSVIIHLLLHEVPMLIMLLWTVL
jgi:hypothetical protein